MIARYISSHLFIFIFLLMWSGPV